MLGLTDRHHYRFKARSLPVKQVGKALERVGTRQRGAALVGGLAGSHLRSGSRYAKHLPDPIPSLVNLLLTKQNIAANLHAIATF
jgi:hypothetical protein